MDGRCPRPTGPDPTADPSIRVDASQWPTPPDEVLQATWGARWLALAVAKPFVRSVTWLQASDASPHVYPHGGLFRADQTAEAALRLAAIAPPRTSSHEEALPRGSARSL